MAERACRKGILDKVVLTRSVTRTAPDGMRFSAAATIRALRAANPDAIVFAVGDGRGRVFCGATPEVLLRVRGGSVTTHALAGTCARSDDPDERTGQAAALLASDKDRREHAFVVDQIAAALAPFCDDVSHASAPRIKDLPRLMHLETPIFGRLRAGVRWPDIVAALHPTPAVCGSPRHAALAWLRRHEHLERGGYAGHFGWVDAAGDGACAVALRCALLHGDRATLYAGAGVVAGSEPEAEWHETELKLQSAAEALRAEAADVR